MTNRDSYCYCQTCKRVFHYLGITRHRAMHRDRKENCTIEYKYETIRHLYSESKNDS